MAIGGKTTILTNLLGFVQFDQKVSEKLAWPRPIGLNDPMKQTKTHKMRFKQPQNEDRSKLKLTPRSKKNKTRERHRKIEHLQR